jgi:serine/threonine protein kinase
LVSALDYGKLDEGAAYLVMQLARGENLRQRLEREHALAWPMACEVIEQIADAVAAAHAVGIVHRDLKPENVILEPREGSALPLKVLDFGIAHLRADAEATTALAPGRPLTQLGVVMGTPGYMGPEQAVGQPVDERTDIYSLGVVLWELIAGRRPFEGQSLTEIVTQQFASEPPRLPLDAQAVPEALSTYLAQMLASRPDARPQSAADVRERMRELRSPSSSDLAGILATRDVLAPLRSTVRRCVDRAPAFLEVLATAQRRVRSAPSKYKLLGGLVALVLLLGLALSSGDQADTLASPTDETGQVSAARRKRGPPRDAEDAQEAPAKSQTSSGNTKLRHRLRAIFR